MLALVPQCKNSFAVCATHHNRYIAGASQSPLVSRRPESRTRRKLMEDFLAGYQSTKKISLAGTSLTQAARPSVSQDVRAIKISTKPPLLGRAYHQVLGLAKATSQEDTLVGVFTTDFPEALSPGL